MKKIYLVLIIIAAFLIISEFVFIPIPFLSTTIMGSCYETNLKDMVNRSSLILLGAPVDYKWISRDGYSPETHTKVKISEILRGNYADNEITVVTSGGCNKRLHYCIYRTGTPNFDKKDGQHLIFLSNDEGLFRTNSCIGIIPVSIDTSGKEILRGICGFWKDVNCMNESIFLDQVIEQIRI